MKLSFMLTFIPVARALAARPRLLTENNDYDFIKGDGYDGCIEPRNGSVEDGKWLVLGDCSDELNTWSVEEIDGGFVRFHSRRDDDKCLQATKYGSLADGSWMRIYPCDDTSSLQSFAWDGNKIMPQDDPGLCVVYNLGSIDIGSRIILRDCGVVEAQESNGAKRGWILSASGLPPDVPTPPPANGGISERTIFTDPNDRRLLRITNDDGVEVAYFGTKDNVGSATSFDEYLVNEGNKTTVARLDSMGRPVFMLSDDRSRMELNWVSDTVIVVNYVTGDGDNQGITEIDLETLGGETNGGRKLLRGGTAEPGVDAHQSPARELQSDLTLGTATIELLRCGDVPVEDAVVQVEVTLESSTTGETRLDTYLATHNGSGVYTVDFALGTVDVEEQPIQEACETLANVLDYGCTGLGVIRIEQVPFLCAMVAVPFGESPGVLAACGLFFESAFMACNTVGYSPHNGPSNVTEELCNGLETINPPEVIVADQVTIQPFVLSHQAFLSPQTVPLSGPFPNFLYDNVGEEEPTVESFTIDPADPAPGQDYVAAVRAACVKDSVSMTIVGTDQYADEVTCDAFDSSIVECLLYVPGADADIFDEVTLFIDGEPIRSVGIVF